MVSASRVTVMRKEHNVRLRKTQRDITIFQKIAMISRKISELLEIFIGDL